MSDDQNASSSPPETHSPDSSAKEYTPPELEEYGSLTELTAGPKSGTLDQLVGGDGGFQSSVS